MLDTSIQIERLIGPYTKQIAIEKHLQNDGRQFFTSNYVVMEFQRTVIADYIRVYNHILQYKDWEGITQSLRRSQIGHRSRALGRTMQILTHAMVSSHLNLDDAADLLKVQIRRELQKRFWRNVTPIADQIVCDLVVLGVSFLPNGTYAVADTCRKENATCSLPDFLAHCRAELRLAVEALTTGTFEIKEQAKVVRLLQAIIADPRAVLGQMMCWPLGDLFIILQTPVEMPIWSLDADFEGLAKALNRTLYIPKNLSS